MIFHKYIYISPDIKEEHWQSDEIDVLSKLSLFCGQSWNVLRVKISSLLLVNKSSPPGS